MFSRLSLFTSLYHYLKKMSMDSLYSMKVKNCCARLRTRRWGSAPSPAGRFAPLHEAASVTAQAHTMCALKRSAPDLTRAPLWTHGCVLFKRLGTLSRTLLGLLTHLRLYTCIVHAFGKCSMHPALPPSPRGTNVAPRPRASVVFRSAPLAPSSPPPL